MRVNCDYLDLKGRKVRTFGPSLDDLGIALGATPVSLAYGETYVALERGVVDCAITGSASGNAAKWYEVTAYEYTLPLSWAVSGYYTNLAWWNKLAPDDEGDRNQHERPPAPVAPSLTPVSVPSPPGLSRRPPRSPMPQRTPRRCAAGLGRRVIVHHPTAAQDAWGPAGDSSSRSPARPDMYLSSRSTDSSPRLDGAQKL